MRPRFLLWFSSADAQFNEALRRWRAGDRAGAVLWGRQAARRSNLAKVALAEWLTHRRRDADATKEALKLLTEAAEAGFSEAQQTLAAWYLDKPGIRCDPELALSWARRAADQGNLSCQIALVDFLTSGKYREPDLKMARHYAELAAEQGHSELLAALVQEEHALKRE